jgi:hypothetical protein
MPRSDDMLSIWTGPDVTWATTRNGFEKILEYCLDRKVRYAMHLNETPEDNDMCRRNYGKPIVDLLDEIGFLTDQFLAVHCVHLTQDEISKKLSIPRSSIANSLRILNLPEDILEMIKTDEISLGHAKVILSVSDEKMQRELAQQTAEKQLSVRQCELLAKSMVKKPKAEKQSKVPSIVKEVEIALSEMHGTPVRISYKDGKGTLNITFNSQEQLLELANLLEKK